MSPIDDVNPITRGACVWLTGLSGAGKSTLVEALIRRLEVLDRSFSVLDVVPLLEKQWCERTSEGKLERKAYVAGEIVRHGGIAICVTVSARESTRQRAREIAGAENFLEVFVDVPADVASERKARRGRKPVLRKRLKRAARRLLNAVRGESMTGYQVPMSPDVIVDAVSKSPDEGADAVIRALMERDLLHSEHT